MPRNLTVLVKCLPPKNSFFLLRYYEKIDESSRSMSRDVGLDRLGDPQDNA